MSKPVTVLLGDPSMSDPTKLGGGYTEEDLRCVSRMQGALESLQRYQIRYLNQHETLIADLAAAPPEFVLNFCDTGFRNQARHEWHLAGYLELLDIPYSGAPPFAMAVCYDKGIVRALAESLAVPVPVEHYFETAEAAMDARSQFPFPVLIKPNQGDGSVGITKDAVVHEADQARAYLEYLGRTLPGRALIVQEFLPGKEYGVGVVGNPGGEFTVLPPLEVDFSGLDPGLAPILSFESKVDPDSPYWTKIRYQRAALAPGVQERLADIVVPLFKRLGLRDYGRFDFRTGVDGEIKLMEVNPNPAWDYGAKLAMMAGFAGLSYAEMLGLIVETGMARIARERG